MSHHGAQPAGPDFARADGNGRNPSFSHQLGGGPQFGQIGYPGAPNSQMAAGFGPATGQDSIRAAHGRFHPAKRSNVSKAGGCLTGIGIVALGLALLIGLGVAVYFYTLRDVTKAETVEQKWAKIQQHAPSETILDASYDAYPGDAEQGRGTLRVSFLVDGQKVTLSPLDMTGQHPKKLDNEWNVGGTASQVRMEDFLHAIQNEANKCNEYETMHADLYARDGGNSIIQIVCTDRAREENKHTTTYLDVDGEQIDAKDSSWESAVNTVFKMAEISFPDEVFGLSKLRPATWHGEEMRIVGPKVRECRRGETLQLPSMQFELKGCLVASGFDEAFSLSELDPQTVIDRWAAMAESNSVHFDESEAVVKKSNGEFIFGLMWGKLNPNTEEYEHHLWIDQSGKVFSQK